MSVIYIYALTDPRDNTVRYIGKTNNVNKRLSEHIKESGNTYKINWINNLSKQNLKPSIQIIDTATELTWKIKEQYWIGMFPDLTNLTSGGEGNIPSHLKSRGSNHGKSKLDNTHVLKIIELYKYTNLSQNDLAKLFNVSVTPIYYILNGIKWKHINNGNKTISLFKKRKLSNPNKNGKLQGETCHLSKLTDIDIIQIKILLDKNISCYKIAKEYCVSRSTIQSIKMGETWKHIV